MIWDSRPALLRRPDRAVVDHHPRVEAVVRMAEMAEMAACHLHLLQEMADLVDLLRHVHRSPHNRTANDFPKLIRQFSQKALVLSSWILFPGP